MDLTLFDHVVLNTSAGKDSQAMMDYVSNLARLQGVHHRLIAVHADLGRVEWKGTRELAEEQCAHYDIPLHVVSRPQGDLLDQVEARKMWPDSGNRYCTSDQKRDQIAKIIRHLQGSCVLNCLGFRAEESAARAKRKPVSTDPRLTNGKRKVTVWLPIHTWRVEEVWSTIRASGVRYHFAYDLGMPRLSCAFCILAPPAALMLAGQHNRELLDKYVSIEKEIGHDFRHKFKIESIAQALDAGEKPGPIQNWTM